MLYTTIIDFTTIITEYLFDIKFKIAPMHTIASSNEPITYQSRSHMHRSHPHIYPSVNKVIQIKELARRNLYNYTAMNLPGIIKRYIILIESHM